MKNRSALMLIELTVMLLVFCVAAAVCIGAFVWSERASVESAQQDRAYLELQTAAEVLKQYRGDVSQAAALCGGSWEAGRWQISYAEDWTASTERPAFFLRVIPVDTEHPGLGAAELTLVRADGVQLASLKISWQEVAP